ncbi:translocation/assembly module TamB domain-containing protein [candidate division KSB1 bacterium]|nr:translocation/assembly module TamB domain-containing protein [candidate division KSB1 bacterium]
MRSWLKIIIYFILTITLVFGGVVFFTQTQIFKNWLKNKIITEANKNLNASLSVGKIQGNFLTHFRISQIILVNSQTDSIRLRRMESILPDTILSLPELTINFSPARLLNKEIVIKFIALNSLHFRLRQLPDSSWNVEHFVISEPDTAAKAPEPSQPMQWRIALNNMKLKDARFDFIPLRESPFIPQRIETINTQASLVFDRKGLKVDLKNFRLLAQNPNFVLKKLSLDLSLVENNLIIRHLSLQTSASHIQGEGELEFSDQPKYRANLSAAPLDFSEVQNFIPGFPMEIQASLNLTAALVSDSLKFDLELGHQDQSLKLNGNINNLDEILNFDLAGILTRVKLEDWLTIPDLTGLINGQLDLRGNGNSEKNANLFLTANFSNGAIYQRSFESIIIKADYLKGDLESDIRAVGNFGQFQLNSHIADILREQQFNLEGKFSHIDLRPIVLDDSLATDISLAVHATGANFLPEKMQAAVTLDASPSAFLGVKIDTLFSIFNFQDYNFTFDTLDVASRLAQLHLSGNLDLVSESRIRFTGEVGDLEQIKSILHADSLRARGNIAGFVQGKFDSLFCEAKYNLNDLLYDTITSDSVIGNVSLSFISDSLKLQSASHVTHLAISDFPFDSAFVRTNIINNLIGFSADVFHSDGISGQFEATLIADSVTQLTIPSIRLNLKNHVWTGGNDSMRVLLGQDDFEFYNIKLTSENQFIRLGGTLSLVGNQYLFLEISNTDISPFLKLIETPLTVQGKTRLFLEMKGTAESPFIEGMVSIIGGKVNEYDFQGVDLNVSYENQLFMFIASLNYDKTNSLVAIGSIPLNLSLTNDQQILDYDKPIDVNLKADGLDFSVLQAFSEDVRKVKGKILIDVKLENTLNNPLPSGYLRLENGELQIPEFGVTYKDIQVSFIIDTSSFAIDKFQARSDKGILTATGKIDFTQSSLNGVIKTTNVDMTAENFLAINNKNYEVIIDGDVNLTGDPAAPQFGGSIRVLRSRFYIPALIQATPQTDEDSQPILVDALKDSIAIQAEQIAKANIASQYLDNLKGSIKVEIPRNTWLRSTEMNVEIAGDVNVVKQSEIFELFGTIRIIRGSYDLYGKRFVIQKGSFSFDGGAEYNPEIELIANHILRTFDRQKKTLTLEVTGKALTPKLKFTLDDNEVSEGDAVSYLVLGRSLEELTHGQRSDLSQQAGFNPGDEASNIMVGLVANQLSRTIGRTLNLDVIEVKGEENWQQATFVVGKYLTNDLFFRYQTEFGFRQTNELQPDEITLEYEINRRLFLQLTKGSEKTTGFDIVLKFEK